MDSIGAHDPLTSSQYLALYQVCNLPWSANDLCLSYDNSFLLFLSLELPSVSSAGRCVKASSSRPFCFSSSCLIAPEKTSHWDGVLDWYFFQHFGIKFQSSCWLRGKTKILKMCESLVLAPPKSVALRDGKKSNWTTGARDRAPSARAVAKSGRKKSSESSEENETTHLLFLSLPKAIPLRSCVFKFPAVNIFACKTN